LEVSSHALTQDRVEGIVFDAAVFTNLGHDHLDHHGTIESYFAAKASLFTPERSRIGIVNADDPWGRQILETRSADLVPYSMSEVEGVEISPSSTRFSWRGRQVVLNLAGLFQVPNALSAATTSVALGIPEDIVVEGLCQARPVAGRFEVVDTGLGFVTVVDYAHTPEGLEVALASARSLAGRNRVVVVFGAGGERDKNKRPAMGTAAAEADLVVITSANPPGEDPLRIIDDVRSGVPASADVLVEPDRRQAIEAAFEHAGAGDVVLIAGKGHETDIEIGQRRVPFDDRLEALAAARRRVQGRTDARGGAGGSG